MKNNPEKITITGLEEWQYNQVIRSLVTCGKYVVACAILRNVTGYTLTEAMEIIRDMAEYKA